MPEKIWLEQPRMILKAVIMSLALVAGTSALPEMNDDDINISVSADEVATVVWDYLSQLNSDASGTVDQRAELTQKLKTFFQENMLVSFQDKLFPDEMEKELVPFAIDLYKCLTKDLQRKKEEIQKELEDLQGEMAPHTQEVKQKVGDNARLLQKILRPYSNMLKDVVDRMSFLNAQVIKSIKDLENGLSDNAKSLQALVSSMPNKIKENFKMNLLEFQAILIEYQHEIKKMINHPIKELNNSLAPFVQDMHKLNHQLEGLSFQLNKETLKLVANISASIQELWKLLEPAMLRGNMDELQKSLAKLNRSVEEQVEEFQLKVSPYIETFDKAMGQKVEEFGQKLGPHAGYMDDHLIFLEKDLKDKVKSSFNSLKKKIQNRKTGNVPIPNPTGAGTELGPLEQNSANLG
ncbi:apolipoprotein A-IV-like [Suncus etruscus]|uniref:apolipoprotein A-IV-like n=1 Tax=Suncus etruscus TaxID=109475 RepID=UPI00210F2B7D|nr:apolipoprotein A-IV-like [Suncus etruscus]